MNGFPYTSRDDIQPQAIYGPTSPLKSHSSAAPAQEHGDQRDPDDSPRLESEARTARREAHLSDGPQDVCHALREIPNAF